MKTFDSIGGFLFLLIRLIKTHKIKNHTKQTMKIQ